MKPGKHQRSKQRSQDLCWKLHNPASFVLPSTLSMNNVTNTFLRSRRFRGAKSEELAFQRFGCVKNGARNNYCVLCRVKAKRQNYNIEL